MASWTMPTITNLLHRRPASPQRREDGHGSVFVDDVLDREPSA